MTTTRRRKTRKAAGSPRGRRPSTPLSVERIAEAARRLLVEGGPDAVVVRELARGLDVTAPALYKHVASRDDLLTLLISSFYDELTDQLLAAIDDHPPGDHRGRLRAAGVAFRTWSVTNKAEFNLLFGAPLQNYEAPEDGPTTGSAQRFGRVFFDLSMEALADGKLRTRDNADVDPALRQQLETYIRSTGLDLEPGQIVTVLLGWQRLLGSVAVECAGQLAPMVDDASPFTLEAMDHIMDDMLL